MFQYGASEVIAINRICDDKLYSTLNNDKIGEYVNELRDLYNELYRLWELFPNTCVEVSLINDCFDRVSYAIKYYNDMVNITNGAK